MMKRGNLKAILIVVLVILGVMFVVSFYDENKEVIQGLAPLPQIGCSCTDQGYTVGGGSCLSWDRPKYCLPKGDPPECSIVDNCDECGCNPPWECNQDGVSCSRYGDEGGDPNPPGEDYCSGHWQCGTSELCVDKDGALVNIPETSDNCYEDDYDAGDNCGQCQDSIEGDDFCSSTYLEEFGYRVMNDEFESCQELGDCEDGVGPIDGACTENYICQEDPFDPSTGQCNPYEAPKDTECIDGTLPGQCSLSEEYYGYKCQQSGDDMVLVESCQSCEIPYEFCPDGYQCNQDGSCTLGLTDNGEETSGEGDEEDNYCEYVGGECEGQCGEGFYDVSDLEGYEQLTDSCVEEYGASEVCCYPYENDDVNDCTHYNGTCMASECSGDYISPDIEYLDEECEYYIGESQVCCLESIGLASEESEDKGFFDYIFGDPSSGEYSADKGFGENFSLNRSYVFGVLFLAVFVVLLVIIFAPKKK